MERAAYVVFSRYTDMSGHKQTTAYTLATFRGQCVYEPPPEHFAAVEQYCKDHPNKHVRISGDTFIYPDGRID
jgi:hypothetical protein